MIRRNDGFSLNELMVVIGIIAIMAAIAMPNLIGWLPKYRLSAAAREMMGAVEHARTTAIRHNADVIVTFDFAANSYRATLDGNTVKAGVLPAGIDLKEPPSGSLGPVFRFNSQGMPVDASGNATAGRVVVAAGAHVPEKAIRVNVGGNVRIQAN
jgi:prepilin-type N-terminal cleavage/methylation domain-containing protein